MRAEPSPCAALTRHSINRGLRWPHGLVLLAVGLWLLGCGAAASTAGSCSLDSAAVGDDNASIKAVIQAEGQLVVAQDIDGLMALWAEDAFIANAKNTADFSDDDQFWRGHDAIRHRYVRTVFPGAPATAAVSDLTIEHQGDRAEVRSTTNIGSEVAPSGDRWVLRKERGCWVIESLTYNLEPAP